MELSVLHDRQAETSEDKARWFQSLTLAERMNFLCAMTDLILENNLRIAQRKNAESSTGRVCVLSIPAVT